MKTRRVLQDKLLIGLSTAAVVVAIIPLVAIIYDVTLKGITSFDLNFFTKLPPLPNKNNGGLGNAVQGTFILVGAASAIGIPIGLLSGVYMAEYGGKKYGSAIRFLGDSLAGIPSIVTGILVYTLLVIPMGTQSMIAGSIALACIMIPIVSNASGQALRAVPNSIREASTALGVRKWRTTFVVAANAKSSLATGSLLAAARAMGETAPLLLTAGLSRFWFKGPDYLIASMPYYIYSYATSPYTNWQNLAWTSALVLLIIVLGINAVVRTVTRSVKIYA